MKSTKLLLIVFLFVLTSLAFPWGSELCQGCRIDSSALAGPIYTFPNSQMFQQMISTNGTFLFQDAIDRLPVYSGSVKLEIRVQDKAQLRLAYDVNNYVDFWVGSGGTVTINAKDSIVFNPMSNVVVASGNVGVGVMNPTAKLEVNGNIVANNPIASNHVATKAYVDASTAGNAQETSLTDIKGAGFTSGNASLKVISDKVALQTGVSAVNADVVSASNKIGVATDAAAMSTTLFAGQQYLWDNRKNFGKAGVTAMSAKAASTYTHSAAASYCYGLSAAAQYAMDNDTTTVYDDWRLPTVMEGAIFEGTVNDADYIWTATVRDATGYGWIILRLSDGYWFGSNTQPWDGSRYYVRCVR